MQQGNENRIRGDLDGRQPGGTSRRRFISGALAAGVLALGAWRRVCAAGLPIAHGIDHAFLGLVPFDNEPSLRQDEMIGAELDARLFTNLSMLDEQKLVVPADKFYIRTGASKLLPPAESWTVRIQRRKETELLTAEQLESKSLPQGACLMECAGNTRATGFGLMSAANWNGIPMSRLLERVKQLPKQILISGFDQYASTSMSSVAGASWIFTPDQLYANDSFLATHINGARLTADHGGPFRLVVPGFYGCASIKWVKEITLLDDGDAESTSQMLEYALRTGQRGLPSLAREYAPPHVEPAAMPIRVERWRIGSELHYQVIGIAWGGREVETEWEIQFNPDAEYAQIRSVAALPGKYTWALWKHEWKPIAPGKYSIKLRPRDPAVPARRARSGHYMRSVTISES